MHSSVREREIVSRSIGDIDLRNPQDTWKQIGKIFNIRKRQPHGTETVSAEQFYEYFKQQNAAPTNGDQTDLEDTGVIEDCIRLQIKHCLVLSCLVWITKCFKLPLAVFSLLGSVVKKRLGSCIQSIRFWI